MINELIDPSDHLTQPDGPPIALHPANIAAILGARVTVAEHLAAARDLHAHAARGLAEARAWEAWPRLSHRAVPLREAALDDLLAAVDTLLAAVAAREEGRHE